MRERGRQVLQDQEINSPNNTTKNNNNKCDGSILGWMHTSTWIFMLCFMFTIKLLRACILIIEAIMLLITLYKLLCLCIEEYAWIVSLKWLHEISVNKEMTAKGRSLEHDRKS